MIASWFVGASAEATGNALDAANVDGLIAVLGNVRLARALAEQGRSVVAVDADPRNVRRAKLAAVCGAADQLPFPTDALAALVAADADPTPIREWSRAVREGGPVILVDRADPTELSRRALCGGLMEIEQRVAGRATVTSGRVVNVARER